MRHPRRRSPYSWIVIAIAAPLLAAFSFGPSIVHAQAFVTQNDFVGGLVYSPSDGKVTFTQVVNKKATAPPAKILSFQDFSYLTLLIDGQYYTNNTSPPPSQATSSLGGNPFAKNYDVALDNGSTRKIKDTIETTWPEGDFDIVQDIYPVAFRNSGQIVLKVKIVNHTTSSHSVQAQYLLDVADGSNDHAFMLDQFSYEGNMKWNIYKSAPPTFYMGFEGDPATLNVGTIGAGYTTDAYAPGVMGLTPCSGMVFGDDAVLAGFTFGSPPAQTSTVPLDASVLMQWPQVNPPGKTDVDSVTEIFRTSYGTQEFCLCLGNVIGISVHPTQLTFNQKTRKYSPNPFNVEELIINTSGSALNNVHIKQSVSGSLRIIGNPTDSVPATIGAGQVGDYTWTDSTVLNTNCNGAPSVCDLTFDMFANGLQQPVWPDGCNGSCDVLVDCADVDTTAPIVDNVHSGPAVGVFSETLFNVHDSSSKDFGMKNIQWSQISGPPANFIVTPPIGVLNGVDLANCPKSVFTFDIKQKDSAFGGCFEFIFLDCAGNTRKDTFCFATHPVPAHYDVYPPIFVLESLANKNVPENLSSGCDDTSNAKRQNWMIIDTLNQPHAHGIRSTGISAIGANNMTLTLTPFAGVADSARFHVDVVDSMKDGSICVVATDTAGNSDTICLHYCTVPDTQAPLVSDWLINAQHGYRVHVSDSGAWQRGLDSVYLVGTTNVTTTPAVLPNGLGCVDTTGFDINVIHPFKVACFQVYARDCAGNHILLGPICLGGDTDIHPPVLTATPIGTNSMLIEIIDSADPSEQGIDSVWFSTVQNMHFEPIDPSNPPVAQTVGPNTTGTFATFHGRPTGKAGGHPTYQQSVSFKLTVDDSNNVVSPLATVTVCAVDGATHQLQGGCYTWNLRMFPDSLPPVILGTNPTCQSIDIGVTDTQARDRGLSEFKLTNTVNFHPFDDHSYSPSHHLTLNVMTPGKSAFAQLWAVDTFGAKNPTLQSSHSASGSLWIYAQDLSMQAAHVFTDTGYDTVPVMIVKQDSVPLGQKQIRDLTFTFHLDGSPLIDFVKVLPGSFAPGWTSSFATNPSPPAPARSYTITASGPPLPDWTPGPTPDVILRLIFHGNWSSTTGETNIHVDPVQCGTLSYEVSYNGGKDSTIFGQNTIISVPAPFGNLGGGTMTLKGACAPFISEHGAPPTAISLAPITPNPATVGTPALQIDYTIPTEGPVTLSLYNALGVQVRTIVSETQKQGEYRIEAPADGLPEGIYFLRLVSGGESRLRRVVLGQ
ncbi:MAG: T9SS type A sorting domain-containing protein [Bacteroidota bacterium]|nr:T9SS type A sorting domain-containing protein [Bacteroidota bacterium]